MTERGENSPGEEEEKPTRSIVRNTLYLHYDGRLANTQNAEQKANIIEEREERLGAFEAMPSEVVELFRPPYLGIFP